MSVAKLSDQSSRFKQALLLCVALACLVPATRAQNVEQITVAGQKSILAKPVIEVPGPRDPDISVVEYFDYNCPYCKKFAPTLQALSAGDTKIVVIYQDC